MQPLTSSLSISLHKTNLTLSTILFNLFLHQLIPDIEHFLSHQKIEDEEDERTREFISDPHSHDQIPLIGEDGLALPLSGDGSANNAARIIDEAARVTRAAKARAQAQQFGEEADKRGEWGKETFARPKDDADRLRKAVPYKFRIRGNSWNRDL